MTNSVAAEDGHRSVAGPDGLVTLERVRAGQFIPMAGCILPAKMGQLACNLFITLTSGLENLVAFGKTVLWKGAQKIRFEEV